MGETSTARVCDMKVRDFRERRAATFRAATVRERPAERQNQPDSSVTYLITLLAMAVACAAMQPGSVDRWHNVSGAPVVEEHLARAAFEEERMDHGGGGGGAGASHERF
jgi:hypothetical protein